MRKSKGIKIPCWDCYYNNSDNCEGLKIKGLKPSKDNVYDDEILCECWVSSYYVPQKEHDFM